MRTMEELRIVIEKTSDYYDAYAENCDGIYGAGNSIEEVKENIKEAIRLIKEELPREQWPEILKGEYTVKFQMDVRSFLEHYRDRVSLSGLEMITGINQKQLSNYLHSRSTPRKAQRERINEGISKFAHELMELTV